MAFVKSDGNGGLTIPKWFTGLLAFAIFTAGFGAAWATQKQAVADHLCNAEIHIAHSVMKDEFASQSDLGRVETKLDRVLETQVVIQQGVARIEGRGTGGTP